MKNVLRASTMVVIAISLLGCKQIFEESEPKTWNFGSPEEILENPDVDDALTKSGGLYGDLPLHIQKTPPSIGGIYKQSGKVVGTDPPGILSGATGSTIEFFNQTSDGKISMTETTQYYGSATAHGNFVTGSGGSFTVWQEVKVESPSDSNVFYVVVVILSGTPNSNGYDFNSLSVLTEKTQGVVANINWWRIEGTLTPTSSPSALNLTDFSKQVRSVAITQDSLFFFDSSE